MRLAQSSELAPPGRRPRAGRLWRNTRSRNHMAAQDRPMVSVARMLVAGATLLTMLVALPGMAWAQTPAERLALEREALNGREVKVSIGGRLLSGRLQALSADSIE